MLTTQSMTQLRRGDKTMQEILNADSHDLKMIKKNPNRIHGSSVALRLQATMIKSVGRMRHHSNRLGSTYLKTKITNKADKNTSQLVLLIMPSSRKPKSITVSKNNFAWSGSSKSSVHIKMELRNT